MIEMMQMLAGRASGHFGERLHLSEPRIFSTVPDEPIEMPSAVFVQPLVWRNENAYHVVGLSSPEFN